jgi:group I intron endonuclease
MERRRREFMGIIYSARNKINGKRYIGATTWTLNHRISGHKARSNDIGRQHPLYRAIREFGWENFEWEVLYKDIAPEMMEVAEMCTIYIHGSFDDGYNTTLGGKGQIGNKWDDERKAKHSDTRKGIPSKCRGRKLSEGHKQKLSISHLGQVAWNKGRKCSEEWIRKNVLANGGRPFLVFRGEEKIGEWINQRECAKELGINNKEICSCLKGRQNTHKGYTFKYGEVA